MRYCSGRFPSSAQAVDKRVTLVIRPMPGVGQRQNHVYLSVPVFYKFNGHDAQAAKHDKYLLQAVERLFSENTLNIKQK